MNRQKINWRKWLKKEEEQTKQEDQSLQQQIQAVEHVLTAVQDIGKLDREQA